jgi:hypothetical protein
MYNSSHKVLDLYLFKDSYQVKVVLVNFISKRESNQLLFVVNFVLLEVYSVPLSSSYTYTLLPPPPPPHPAHQAASLLHQQSLALSM